MGLKPFLYPAMVVDWSGPVLIAQEVSGVMSADDHTFRGGFSDDRVGDDGSSTVSIHGTEGDEASKLSIETTNQPVTPTAPRSSSDPELELQVGQLLLDRFEIRKRLGKGGFGTVYAAYDRHLNRTVAIKQSRSLKSFVAGQVREEARAIASLNHPNIVQIHDLIERGEHEWLIIMECLEGVSLSQRMRQSRLSISDAVRLSLKIAEALMHAHERHLVHSDLKPGNLFLCDDGRVKLLDFGLAVAHFPDQDAARIGGTPGYMSPEQIRGESHLIDGRTDVWAFGVVLYEMLTGVKPFAAKDANATKARTLFKFAAPPRQLNPDIDLELQRIILRCLEPLIKSRYGSVADLREDLAHWLDACGDLGGSVVGHSIESAAISSRVPSSLRLSNRGLQPFTENDSEVYLSLIPGPRDRNGIPDSIRFWKRWVESDDPHTEHPVGVLYGPSGSGKTSYIRAGLFRQLPNDVCRVYVECRPGDLGGRLTRIIEAQIDRESTESSLRDLLHRLRSGESETRGFSKLLIVLDQFESWALSATLEERQDLAEALRQCDGLQIRALVVTRDDYWVGVKELLKWLEIPMREGRNVASVELLEAEQAEQILEIIGRESGTLPSEDQPLGREQSLFIKQSIAELSVDGKVVCVHLVMFAKMVKMQHWTPRALRDNGGVSGACTLFFHELFGRSSNASPEYRRIAPLVPILLSQLMPSESDTVAEVCKDYRTLEAVAQQQGQGHLLDDCLKSLDEDLRIITVVSSDELNEEKSRQQSKQERRYRLSHDFLVEPLKRYLARTQNRTWSGRTMARLVEMSDLWSRRPNTAYLPGFTEYLTLSVGTVFQPRSESESRFLHAATRLHAGRISVAVIGILGFIFMSIVAWSQWSEARNARIDQLNDNVARLLDCQPGKLADQITTLESFGPQALDEIRVFQTSNDSEIHLRSNLFAQYVAGETFSSLGDKIGDAPPEWFDLFLQVAQKTPDSVSVLTSLVQTNDQQANAAGDNDQQRRLADRAAILLAYLGERQMLLDRLVGSDDLERDGAFLLETHVWRGVPDLWAELLVDSIGDDQRYHAGLVLAGYPAAGLRNANLNLDFASLVNSSDARIHSLGRFLAQHLGSDPSSIALQPPAAANWQVGPYGISMARFEPTDFVYRPGQSRTTKENVPDVAFSVTRPFWCGTVPIPERMYRDFAAAVQQDAVQQDAVQQDAVQQDAVRFETSRSLDRFNLPDYVRNDLDQPAIVMTHNQAIMLCNWLSRSEGKQECYTAIDVDSNAEATSLPPIPWAFDESANGYRLPTDAEYLLTACSGYAHPDNRHAIEIAVAGGYPRSTELYPRRLFTMIPNRSGVFHFDPWCGSWIGGHLEKTYYSLSERGALHDLQRSHFVPLAGVFLCQNADAP